MMHDGRMLSYASGESVPPCNSNNTSCASVRRPLKTIARLIEKPSLFSGPPGLAMGFLQEPGQSTPSEPRRSDSVFRIPVSVTGAAPEMRILDISIEVVSGGPPRYKFALFNSAALGGTLMK